MITKTIWRKEAAEHLRNLPVMALDVGFSATARSSGVAWIAVEKRGSEEMTHQAAITHLISWLKEHRESVLIIEAPLSTAYRDGNPARRGEFEAARVDGRTRTRDWYSGPGAAVTLAALNILRKLQIEGSLATSTVHLLEGFVSFGDTRSHQQVAESLRDAFLNDTGTWFQVEAGLETLTVTTLAGIEGAAQTPAILVPPQNQTFA
jgi:hypothetical protein